MLRLRGQGNSANGRAGDLLLTIHVAPHPFYKLAGNDLELATLSWVHWFNTSRLHSAIGYLPPIEFEQQYYRQINSQPQPLPGEHALH